MIYDTAAFILLSAVALAVGSGVSMRTHAFVPPKLLLAALAMRIAGSTFRYQILFGYYDGLGDAVRYYHEGLALARQVWNLQLSPLSLDYWLASGQWWGTQMLIRISGLVLTVIGPSLRGEFLVFSLISFTGLYLIAKALAHSQPDRTSHHRFAAWLWLWPSLWFWPSSVGKEGILTLAVGLVTYGWVGNGKRISWIPFLAGLGLASSVRPHVTAALVVAAVAAQWLGSWQRATWRRVAEVVVVVVLLFLALSAMQAQFGLGEVDLEGVREFVQFRAQQTLKGGSQIGAVPLGPHGIPTAFVNIWMRPFPWDVHNATAAISALEVLLFWGLAWHRRRAVLLALKNWRRHRLLVFGLPLLLVYTMMIGLAFGNLGIIARQRVLVYPFMIAFLAAAPDRSREVGTPPHRRSQRPQSLHKPAP